MIEILLDIHHAGQEVAEASSSRQSLQFLPAKINFNGNSAKNWSYFNNNFETKDGWRMKNSFRGRPLDGTVVEMPRNHKAVIVEGGRSETLSVAEDKNVVKMRAVRRLDKLTVWEYDEPDISPERNRFARAFQWLELAGSVAGQSKDDRVKENVDE